MRCILSLLVLMFASQVVAVEVVQATLHGAEGSRPLVVLVVHDGGRVERATVLAPLSGDVRRGRGSLHMGKSEIRQLSVTADRVRCRAVLSPLDSEGEGLGSLAVAIDLERIGDQLVGSWAAGDGQGGGPAQGTVERSDSPVTGLVAYLDTPYPGFNNSPRWNGWAARGMVLAELAEGSVAGIRTDIQAPRVSVYGEKGGQMWLVPMPVGAGAVGPLAGILGDQLGSAADPQLEYDANTLQLRWRTDTEDADEIRVEAQRFGSWIAGHYEKYKNGAPIGHRNVMAGHLATEAMALAEPLNLGRGASLHERLAGQVSWLMERDPYIAGPFATPLALASMRCTGNKQYDNEPLNGAAAILAGVVAAAVHADDPSRRAHDMAIARNGASFLGAMRHGPWYLPEYYKHDFFFTPPMGIALLRLYQATGEQLWLDEAVRYADTLRATQRDDGTWTWVDEESQEIGTANHRHDRSWDNLPLHCADFLNFLGLLRTVGGVDEYADVEARAAAWMAQATLEPPEHQGVDYLWRDRRPGESLESSGPTWYLLYLAQFAEEPDTAVITSLHDLLAERHLQGSGATAFLSDSYPRTAPGFQAASTMRYALALHLLAERGLPAPRGLRDRLLKQLIAWQDAATGLIYGADLPDDPLAFGIQDQHAYTFFKAELAWNLHQLIRSMAGD